MTILPEGRRRRTIRLRGYDYTKAGAYFITICARERACLFADIEGNDVHHTPVGVVIAEYWEAIPEHFPAASLDAFVVMPNHLHGIVVLEGRSVAVGTACRAPTGRDDDADACEGSEPPKHERFGAPVVGSIPTIVRSYKAAVTKAINDDPGRGTACRAFLNSRFAPLHPGRIPSPWQRGYHEHVIRNERALDRLRAYIDNNPARWIEDSLHPSQAGSLAPARMPHW